jgi:hypothetical protein
MAATTVQSYRKLLRHLKSLPTPPQNVYYINLVTFLIAVLFVFYCCQYQIKQIRNSPSPTSSRVLRSYAATCSSVTELNYLRGLDSGEKLDQRFVTHCDVYAIPELFIGKKLGNPHAELGWIFLWYVNIFLFKIALMY